MSENAQLKFNEDVTVPIDFPKPESGMFPNRFAFMFIYAPAFDFDFISGAVKYRFVIIDDIHKTHEFYSNSPRTALSSVWEKLPVGFVTVVVYGIDENENQIGIAGKRTFWKKAPFKANSYPPKKRDYSTTAELIFENRYNSNGVQDLLLDKDPVEFGFPTKQISALISAMSRRIKTHPESKDKSVLLIKKAADFLLSISEKEGAPLEGFTPTYRADYPDEKWQGTNMLIYPANGISAFLDAYEATNDEKYLNFAKLGAKTYMRLQGEDGSWPLLLSIKDGSVLNANRCMTFVHMDFFLRLYNITGDKEYLSRADRAFKFIENGPLKTWNWEGQYEDTPPSEMYRNQTLHEACSMAIYITKRYPDDKEKIALARELLRFSEDLFANWEKPFEGGRILFPEAGFGDYNHYWDIDEYIMPSVFEQYGCFTPVDSASAKLIFTYIALYEVEGNELDIQKARVLGDAITRMTDDDGLESTWWNKKELRTSIWTNCMLFCAKALEELALYENDN